MVDPNKMSDGSKRGAPNEVIVHIGGESRTLSYERFTRIELEKMLGHGVWTHIQDGLGEDTFLACAVIAGLEQEAKKTTNIKTVCRWLEEYEEENDPQALAVDILYAIAQSYDKKRAKNLVQMLNDMFKEEKRTGRSGVPLGDAGKQTSTGTTS